MKLYVLKKASPTMIFLIFFSLILFDKTAWTAEAYYEEAPDVTAQSAVLMDGLTGQVLYDKNARERKPPASTTKIMTALLALEGGDLQKVVTISPGAASIGEASLDLKSGEKLTLEELIYGAMLESGNDACVAIAEQIAGTEPNFVLLMNQKAKLLGALETSFKNTNGLPQAGHLTTARDLAIITRYALCNPTFKKVVSTKGRAIGNQGERFLNNTNRLLWSYEWADGVKTGTTNEAGYCLVASASREGRRLISVVLNSENRWSDSIKLLNYGFENFESVRIVTKEEPYAKVLIKEGTGKEIQAVSSEEMFTVIPKGRQDILEKKLAVCRELDAPVRKGQQVGCITVLVNGQSAGSVNLVSDREIERQSALRLFFNKIM